MRLLVAFRIQDCIVVLTIGEGIVVIFCPLGYALVEADGSMRGVVVLRG